jgi:hypothetical protein
MRRFAVSLTWKMTAFFALFGLFVSYLGIVLYGTQATTYAISSAESAIRSAAAEFLPDRSDAFVRKLEAGNSPQLSSELALIQQASLGSAKIRSISIRLRPAIGNGRWNAASIDENGRLELLPLPPNESADMERGLSRKLEPHLFLGAADRIAVYIDLSRPGDEWTFVIKILMDRSSVFGGIAASLPLFLLLSVVWILFCVLFSQYLGRRISRPVLDLVAWAKDDGAVIPLNVLARGDEIGDLSRALFSMHSEIEDEKRELADRAHALSSMGRIDRAVLARSDRAVLFGSVLSSVLDYAPSCLAAIIVRDPDGGGFDVVAAKFADTEEPGAVRLPPGEARPILGFIPDASLPSSLLVRYADCFEVPLEELGTATFEPLGVTFDKGLSLANLPFTVPGFYSGSLVLLRKTGSGPDLPRLKPLADQVGVALNNLEAREESQTTWLAVVRSLVRAVDAKSAWTRGHSERVAALSTAMGQRLCMETRELSRLEIAAVLHDVGKIGVPEALLDKPGRLDEAEMALIRKHPTVGADIVEGLPTYEDVRVAILYHHERWDGSGYPEGLSGEAIPLTARIIALSDVYDAITDDRPYRKGMPAADAREFMHSGSGTLFDPALVRIFLEMLDSGEVEAARSKDMGKMA